MTDEEKLADALANIPDGMEVVSKGLTKQGDLAWASRFNKFVPLYVGGSSLSLYICVIRKKED